MNPKEAQMNASSNQELLMQSLDLISKGIRPSGVSQEKFKYFRKLIQQMEKNRKKGELVHLSKVYGDKHGVTYINTSKDKISH